jgi:predicted metalloprotease
MRIDDEQESGNVEDRRGMGPATIGGGAGLILVVVALVAYFAFGVDPMKILQAGAPIVAQDQAGAQGAAGPPTDPQGAFAAKILRGTEEVWTARFKTIGQTYSPPHLVLYDQGATTACGYGRSAMGPFYCAQDQKVYLDLTFFQDLDSRFGAPGEAARAYVIAHEVGHHVQNLLGITDRAARAEEAADDKAASNRISIAVELQADCFAGVWAKSYPRFEARDVAVALNAAAAVGDDRLQRETQGTVVPDSFTHGSSAQRQHWFRIGYDSGDPNACDTFGTGVGFQALAAAP